MDLQLPVQSVQSVPKDIMLSRFLNLCPPKKTNRCYENYVYLSNISIRLFVLPALPTVVP
jgi:hypothetical protein